MSRTIFAGDTWHLIPLTDFANAKQLTDAEAVHRSWMSEKETEIVTIARDRFEKGEQIVRNCIASRQDSRCLCVSLKTMANPTGFCFCVMVGHQPRAIFCNLNEGFVMEPNEFDCVLLRVGADSSSVCINLHNLQNTLETTFDGNARVLLRHGTNFFCVKKKNCIYSKNAVETHLASYPTSLQYDEQLLVQLRYAQQYQLECTDTRSASQNNHTRKPQPTCTGKRCWCISELQKNACYTSWRVSYETRTLVAIKRNFKPSLYK